MKKTSLIFDIDGTLWDSRALVADGYNAQLRSEGLDHLCVTAERLLPLFGKVMTEIGDILFSSIPVPERYALMDRCMSRENQHLASVPCDACIYPGVKQTMEQLAKSYRLFIVSNSQSGYPEVTMDKVGITHLIEGHLCFGDTGTSKGQTIRTLMSRHGIEKAYYIGDTQGDYEATVEAEVPFIWCSFGFGVPEGYVHRVDSFPELLQLPL